MCHPAASKFSCIVGAKQIQSFAMRYDLEVNQSLLKEPLKKSACRVHIFRGLHKWKKRLFPRFRSVDLPADSECREFSISGQYPARSKRQFPGNQILLTARSTLGSYGTSCRRPASTLRPCGHPSGALLSPLRSREKRIAKATSPGKRADPLDPGWPPRVHHRAAFDCGDRPKGGHPPYGPVMMFKILLLGDMNNLSDVRIQHMILDRFSWLRFLDFKLSEKIPDRNTICPLLDSQPFARSFSSSSLNRFRSSDIGRI